MITTDLQQNPDAFSARSKPVSVTARFATAPGVVDTLEGSIRHATGDAIVTGSAGDTWPVARARFLENYDALACTVVGEDGQYVKRPKEVLALRLTAPCSVSLSGCRGDLRGDAGDYLVQYAPGDWAIVAGDVFKRTYE